MLMMTKATAEVMRNKKFHKYVDMLKTKEGIESKTSASTVATRNEDESKVSEIMAKTVR